jgi:polysaccharide export outer membrane protein
MHLNRIFLVTTFFALSVLSGQSLSDINQLKALQKQFEETGKRIDSDKPISQKISSLEAFEDSLSRIPIDTTEALRLTPDSKASQLVMVEDEEFVDTALGKLQPFGYEIFRKAKLDMKPDVYGPVDADYHLGQGDELIITLWGEVELRHALVVDRNGQVMIPDVGLVNVAGLTLTKTQNKLNRILRNYYSGLKNNKITLEISLGKLRSLRIFVTGEVNQPGAFTVPAYVSPFAMLFYAGGVKASGSLRNIIILRNNERIANVDFYGFLSGHDAKEQVRLQNRDVIVIPPVEKRAWLAGSVGLPGIYEFKEGETLRQLFRFAGGFKTVANIRQIEMRRFLPNRKPVFVNVDFQQMSADGDDLPLMDEDRIFVYRIDTERRNYVQIDGPIFGPRRFAWSEGLTLRQLFAKVDSIRGDAFLERAVITREKDDLRKESFSVNLEHILSGTAGDFVMQPRDVVTFKSRDMLFPVDSVSIYGAINSPGKYVLSDNLTLKDLIYMAGGYAINARRDFAEVARIEPEKNAGNEIATIIRVDLDTTYRRLASTSAEDFRLQAYDNVFIYIDSEWELQRNVSIRGEVVRPGQFSLQRKDEKLASIIARAGGIKETGYIEGARFFRNADDAGQIGVDFALAMRDTNSQENIILEDGDEIFIPERKYTIKIMGGVNFPSSVMYSEEMSLQDYLDAAGGLTELADDDNISIQLANGKRMKEKSFLFFPYLPEPLTPGSTIFVPELAEKKVVDWSGGIRDAAAILASVATVILILNQVK